jgi:caa(3)-type oxidase subunit IV
MATGKVSRRSYFVVFGVLLALTYVMVQAAMFDLGPWNAVVNLTIATTQAFLVALIFMQLRHSSRLTWLVAGGALVWLILLLSTIGDYLTRNLLEAPPSF